MPRCPAWTRNIFFFYLALLQYIAENLLLQMYVRIHCKLTEFFLLKITGMECINTDSVVNYRILKHAAFIEQYAAPAFFGTGCITLMKASKAIGIKAIKGIKAIYSDGIKGIRAIYNDASKASRLYTVRQNE